MEINKLTQEELFYAKSLLVHSVLADLAINDLGLTLDEPEFFSPHSSFSEFGIDSVCGNILRYETLVALSYNLCMLNGGIDLAKKLAKKSGLLNYRLSETVYVTEEYIEEGLKNQLKRFNQGEFRDFELELVTYYRQLFLDYCLEYMTWEKLQERIKSKIKSYNFSTKNYTID